MPDASHPVFGPLEARADPAADRIALRDWVVEAEIGAFQPERGRTQRLRISIVVELAPRPPAGDDVDRVLSYDLLHEAVRAELAAERLNLLETLAERVAARILRAPAAARVFLRLEKLDIGPFALGVEIARSRAEAAPAAETALPRPRVVFLDNAALGAPGLADDLAAMGRRGTPVVLCVGAPDLPRPTVADLAAQRRIDLLAIEQNAWALAARDPQAIVVSTRTELDWALRQGLRVIWAPAKMVLDAPDPPADAAGPALAAWLAGVLGAVELVAHGPATPPAESRVTVGHG